MDHRFGEITAETDFLAIRNQARKRGAVLKQDKGDVLIVGAVHTIGEIARRFRDRDDGFGHEIILSDYMIICKTRPDETTLPGIGTRGANRIKDW